MLFLAPNQQSQGTEGMIIIKLDMKNVSFKALKGKEIII